MQHERKQDRSKQNQRYRLSAAMKGIGSIFVLATSCSQSSEKNPERTCKQRSGDNQSVGSSVLVVSTGYDLEIEHV